MIRVQLTTLPAKPSAPRQWWILEGDDFITAKGGLQLSLVDRDRNPRGTANLEATGVGTTPVGANQGLMKDVRKKFDAALDRWLADLAL
jgi:hypothetical protein